MEQHPPRHPQESRNLREGPARPRLLIEDHHEGLDVSEFRMFEDAGFDVTWCAGPDADHPCPLTEGAGCELVEEADVVLFGLGTSQPECLDVVRSLRSRFPATPVVVKVGRDAGGSDPERLPEGCTLLAFPTSVNGQVRELRKVVRAAKRSAQRGPFPSRP